MFLNSLQETRQTSQISLLPNLQYLCKLPWLSSWILCSLCIQSWIPLYWFIAQCSCPKMVQEPLNRLQIPEGRLYKVKCAHGWWILIVWYARYAQPSCCWRLKLNSANKVTCLPASAPVNSPLDGELVPSLPVELERSDTRRWSTCPCPVWDIRCCFSKLRSSVS